ncbi:hypothetical protein F5876DRAFT_66899 [Lentinula aff. lateritia]|uniref:Uncharacterized protein n=1 Tax=Lentinula aff. lateritia TaxID=2804960 RepID=A0ACC1TX48_9AGAR|nr:hypothetical protein F5876DRAFT_66899 [Lentinula aff. lateritia]
MLFCDTSILFITVFALCASLCANAYPITYSPPPQPPPTPMLHSRSLYSQKWILDTYDKTLQDEDRKVFGESTHLPRSFHLFITVPVPENTLTNVPVGSRIPNDGANNRAMFLLSGENHYNGHPAGDLIMKVLHGKPDDNAFVEVKVLREAGDLIAAGMLRDARLSKTPIPVIIMKKKSGQVLSRTGVYRKASGKEKKRMEREAVGKMCEKVAEFAERKQILRLDNKEENALVMLSGKTVTSVELVDMGPPGIFSVSKDAKREDIIRNQYLCTGTVIIKDRVVFTMMTFSKFLNIRSLGWWCDDSERAEVNIAGDK